MTKSNKNLSSPEETMQPAHRLRLPGFITDQEELGLGDAIKTVTSYFGMRPCGGCQRRAAALNAWMTFTSGRSK
jgi:hypothetical protein